MIDLSRRTLLGSAAALSKIRGVRLASRTSTYAFKGKNADLAQVAAALKVGLVLEGTVAKSTRA